MGRGKGQLIQEDALGAERTGAPPLKCHARCAVCCDQSRLTLSTPWTVAHQAPLSRGFSRQEYCSGLPFLLQGHARYWRSKKQVRGGRKVGGIENKAEERRISDIHHLICFWKLVIYSNAICL